MNVRFISLLFLALISFHCKPIPTYPKDMKNTTFTIPEPQKFDCYKNHQYTNPPSGDKISVLIQLRTFFWNARKQETLDTKMEAPIKLTTSGRGKLTTCFAGEDLVVQVCQG
jgi:hypothetical protein